MSRPAAAQSDRVVSCFKRPGIKKGGVVTVYPPSERLPGIMKFDTIPAKNLEKYSDRSKYIFIDVRSPEEFWQGHIPGAINIPYETLRVPMSGLGRNKTYILYCDRGATSLLAARRLYQGGYDVLSVIGGLAAYRGPMER